MNHSADKEESGCASDVSSSSATAAASTFHVVQNKYGGNADADADAARLQRLLDQLASCNLSTTTSNYVEMPMICVLGGTSSGKSSLLSQLSDIELPSAHTLTTRCPG